jgi:K+-transporting ATPase A subunit
MEVVILVLVLIAVLVSIASGIWVAIALIRAISTHQRVPAARFQANEKCDS